jgi:hypothetical protein
MEIAVSFVPKGESEKSKHAHDAGEDAFAITPLNPNQTQNSIEYSHWQMESMDGMT